MIKVNLTFPVLVLSFTTLVTAPSVQAQSTAEPLVFATQAQTVQQQLNALKAQVAFLRTSDSTLKGEISVLTTSNTALQNQVKRLQTGNATLEIQISSLQKGNATLQNQLATVRANPVLTLGPFVSVDNDPQAFVLGPNITFRGANIHIVSGAGATDENGGFTSGLGNLIIGYDEIPTGTDADSFYPVQRGGSHNLVIGRYHRFMTGMTAGLVAGEFNTISATTSVLGGSRNTASGVYSSVTGGFNNTASGYASSVLGGGTNTASGNEASVSGGGNNTANGTGASVTGGNSNTSQGETACVVGGDSNFAYEMGTVVLGGQSISSMTNYAIRPQPPFAP